MVGAVTWRGFNQLGSSILWLDELTIQKNTLEGAKPLLGLALSFAGEKP